MQGGSTISVQRWYAGIITLTRCARVSSLVASSAATPCKSKPAKRLHGVYEDKSADVKEGHAQCR